MKGIGKFSVAVLLIMTMLLGGCASAQEPKIQADTTDDNYRAFYQIFVGSFSDSDGDGIGDIRGIINRMDYLNDGKMTTLRKWYGAGSNLEGVGPPESMGKLKGDTAEDITAYVVTGKQMLLEKFKDKPRNEFDITKLPTMAQFRTIRRIVGAEDFNAIEGETYENSIGNIGDFRYSGKHYQIPYGALYNPGFDNLLACGRIISAPQGDGWEVARVIPTCALTGEVAGKGAANAIDNNMSVSKVNVKELLR